MRRARRKPGASGLVVNGRRLTAPQASMLRLAVRSALSGDAHAARRLCLRLEQEIEAAAAVDWLAGALAETRALEARRGNGVATGPGPVRVGGRDGLDWLRAAGSLTAAQFGAGLRYRNRFEDAQPRIASVLAFRAGGGQGQAGRPEEIAIRMSQAKLDLDRMEQAVVAAFAVRGGRAKSADALMALREVAGLGRSLRELSTSGHRRAVLKARLIEALEAVIPPGEK